MALSDYWHPRTVKRSYTHELIARFANECQIEMLGSAEMVELAEAKLHGEDVSLDALKRIYAVVKNERAARYRLLGCTHFLYYKKNCYKCCQREPGWWILAQRLLAERPGC